MDLLQKKWRESLEALRGQGLWRELALDEGSLFCHNDYLGLSEHPELMEAGREAWSRFRAGSRGSRLLGGNHENHLAAEQALAEFFGAPSALLFSSGYLANLAAVTAISAFHDEIYSDEANHASLIDGVRLSGLRKTIYSHLRPPESTESSTLWITESLFSMDGDVANPDDWHAQRVRTDRGDFLLVDEAHAAGILGPKGRGIFADTLNWRQKAVTVTLGKAFGVGGAVLLCAPELRDWVVNRARSFIFTTAMPPMVAYLLTRAVKILNAEGDSLRKQLAERVLGVRQAFEEQLPPEVFHRVTGEFNRLSPVLPLRVSGNDNALRLAENMREFGFGIRAIRYPTVARGSERLRISLNLGVSQENTEAMVERMVKLWTELSSSALIPT